MNNLENVEELILTKEEQLVISKIEALEDYLEIDKDDLEIVEYNEDDDIFVAKYIDGEEVNYKVYTPEELTNLLKYELIPQEINNAKDELKFNMKYSNYSSYVFAVDEYEIEEYCFENYEELLDTEPRQFHTYNKIEYILLKLY